MVQELKSSFVQIGRSEPSDGYASDANSFHISDTSRESSPSKVFNIPVQIESRAVPQNNVHTVHRPVQSNQPIITSSMNNKSRMEEVDNTSIYSSVKKQSSISRQMSENSYDRSRPCLQPRNRHESESEAELEHFRNGFSSSMSINGSRPETPGFPVTGTPLFNQSTNTLPPKSPGLFGSRVNSRFDLTGRSGSPAGSMYQGDNYFSSRRGSVSSEPTDVPHNQVKLVRDNHKFWYKKDISRDEAISILNTQPPGTFIVRDSNSFPGAFGLALKVATPPPNKGDKDGSSELVRHFLIEPTSKGVKLKGYSNEPVFASLSALIYQHTVTPLALPCKLVIPSQDIGGGKGETGSPEMTQLLQYGAACNVYYLFTQDTDLLTGPQAMRKTVSQLILTRPVPVPTTIHFKVSGQGITLTDQSRRLFFRKHYPVTTISHCGVDPEDRRWNLKSADKSTGIYIMKF